MRRIQPAGLALALAVLVTAGGASATPTWLVPQDLSFQGDGNASAPQVGLDSAGDAIALWSRAGAGRRSIQERERPAGSVWSPAQDLSAPDAVADAPQLAVNPAGEAVAVWYAQTGESSFIQAAQRTVNPGGGWEPSENLSTSGIADSPQVALDEYHEEVAVWKRFDGADWIVQAAFRPSVGPWGAPENLSAPGRDAEEAQVVLGDEGEAVAVWRRFDGANWIVQTATRPSGGPWSAPHDLSAPGGDAEAPQLAVDEFGNVMAVWTRFDGANWMVQAAFRPFALDGGTWSAPENVSAPGYDAREPQVRFDARFGDALAIWTRNGDTIQEAERPNGGTWGQPRDLSIPGYLAESPQLTLDPAGDAVAVWRRYDDYSNGTVEAARRPAGGAWRPQQDLSPAGQAAIDPQVAVDPAGNALAVWSLSSSGQNSVVQAEALDGAGPVFMYVVVPNGGPAGGRLRFSASSVDVWSGREPPHWSFGDGSGANGYNVEHVYARGGSYTVRLRESDTFGNESSLSRTVSIRFARCLVPRLVGKTLAAAKAAIKRGHCRIGFVSRAFSNTVTKGRVLAQRPRAGRNLPRGARVDLVVSRGRRA